MELGRGKGGGSLESESGREREGGEGGVAKKVGGVARPSRDCVPWGQVSDSGWKEWTDSDCVED